MINDASMWKLLEDCVDMAEQEGVLGYSDEPTYMREKIGYLCSRFKGKAL